MVLEVKGITIHNSNNSLSARENYELLLKSKQLNLCHYLVDDKEIIECYPTSRCASHTGKGYDFGNRFTIAIEICKSRCDEAEYLKAEKKAMTLVKKLLKQFKLTKNDIYFHQDFNTVRCPHRILEIYKTKERYLNAYI